MRAILPILFLVALSLDLRAQDTSAVLLAKDATCTGDVKYEGKQESIAHWQGVGSTVSWTLPPLKEGIYNVAITYSLLGLVPKGRQFQIATNGDRKEINVLVKTGGWNAYKTKTLMPLKVTKDDRTFTITALRIPPDAALMNLRSVTLKKAP